MTVSKILTVVTGHDNGLTINLTYSKIMFSVGARVRVFGERIEAEVIRVWVHKARVRFADGREEVYPVSDLELVEGAPPLFDVNQYRNSKRGSFIGDWEWENSKDGHSLPQETRKNGASLNLELGEVVPLNDGGVPTPELGEVVPLNDGGVPTPELGEVVPLNDGGVPNPELGEVVPLNDGGVPNPELGDDVPLTNPPIKVGDVVGTEFGPAVVEIVWEDIDRVKLFYFKDGAWGVYPISELHDRDWGVFPISESKLGETVPLTEHSPLNPYGLTVGDRVICNYQDKPRFGIPKEIGDKKKKKNGKTGEVLELYDFGLMRVQFDDGDLILDCASDVIPASPRSGLGDDVPLTDGGNPNPELGEVVPLTNEQWPVNGLRGLSKRHQILWLIQKLSNSFDYTLKPIDLLPLFKLWSSFQVNDAIAILSTLTTDGDLRSCVDATDSDQQWIEGKKIKGYGPYFYLRDVKKGSKYLGRIIPDELRELKVYYEH